jgi:hypothetical protein
MSNILTNPCVFSGCRLLYLPPYSPDFNPIEEGFSAFKAWIRRNREWYLSEMDGGEDSDPFTMLIEGIFAAMTPDSIVGWYKHSGYI